MPLHTKQQETKQGEVWQCGKAIKIEECCPVAWTQCPQTEHDRAHGRGSFVLPTHIAVVLQVICGASNHVSVSQLVSLQGQVAVRIDHERNLPKEDTPVQRVLAEPA